MTPRPVADAVMARRRTPLDELDYFPTPPWAARAFVNEWLVPLCGAHRPRAAKIWEPAAGGGHMSEVLRESFDQVFASDVHDWGPGFAQGSFVGGEIERATCPFVPTWIVTNPPFNLGVDFARQALATATQGVALLMRLGWAEGTTRFNELFGLHAPSFVIQYAERVPMVKGRWDPDASTATAYAWFVWDRVSGTDTRFRWLPPGRAARWTLPGDRARFAAPPAPAEAPLIEALDLLEALDLIEDGAPC